MFRFTADSECGCCNWPKNKCLCGTPIDQYGGLYALLDVDGNRVPINSSGFPEVWNNGEETKELMGRVAPCYFKVTIEGVQNSTELSSWCENCDNFNGEYYLSKNNGYYDDSTCTYISLLCDASKDEMCGMETIRLTIYPSSITSPQNRPINLQLGFQTGACSNAEFSNPVVESFLKQIGILYSGNYDSNLVGPTILESLDISNIIYSCGHPNSGACDWSNVGITVEALDKNYEIYSIGNDHCSLLQPFPVSQHLGFIDCAPYSYYKNNQYILLGLDGIISKDNDVPFSSALISTCYDCESFNRYIELRLEQYGASLVDYGSHIPMSSLLTVGQTLPSGTIPIIANSWSYDLEHMKNVSDVDNYIDKICCKDSDESDLYTEVASCINKISLHVQRGINKIDVVDLGGSYRTDFYYDHHGVINFIRKDPDDDNQQLVHQLHKRICDSCEIVSNTGPGVITSYNSLLTKPSVDCGGTFGGPWEEVDIYTPIPSSQRPCTFSNVDVEVITSEQSTLSNGCIYHECICKHKNDINGDLSVTIPDAWTDTGNCCRGVTSGIPFSIPIDTSPLIGDFILNSSFTTSMCQVDKDYTSNEEWCVSDTRDVGIRFSIDSYPDVYGDLYANITIGWIGADGLTFPLFNHVLTFKKVLNYSYTCDGRIRVDCSMIRGTYELYGNNTMYVSFPVACLTWDATKTITVN